MTSPSVGDQTQLAQGEFGIAADPHLVEDLRVCRIDPAGAEAAQRVQIGGDGGGRAVELAGVTVVRPSLIVMAAAEPSMWNWIVARISAGG
ncbi:hypothetical protein ACQP1G_09550 [Nocardia sp. CA-107356]|uniref:hypothetical protein n=1 Tax=Nocardia sp. CA-107356 TaxID=3239972 RepID=UPI003D8D2726